MQDVTGPSPAVAAGDPARDRNELGVVPGLIWAFRIHENGTADPLPVDKPIEVGRDGWVWLHFDLADNRAAPWLIAAGLPEQAVTMMLSRDRHQQLHSAGSCVYGIFADLVRGLDGASDEVGHLRFIMTERLLVSGRHHALTAVESARASIEGRGRRLPRVAALLELIVEHVADGVDEIVDRLVVELDHIEESLARRSGDFERQKLASVRRTSVRLHRQLSGLRAVFHRLEREGVDEVAPQLRLAAGKLAQRLDSLDHDVIEMRERGHRLQEEVSAMMMEETNRHLYILSILTTLFLPATLVSGIFGMNTKGLPFTENESGFWWAIAILVASAVIVYVIMRRIGVFKPQG